MKKALLILGVGVVSGVGTYVILQSLKKQKPNIIGTDKKNKDFPTSDTMPTPTQEASVDDVEVARKVAEISMTERHEKAAQIIKDAVEVICKQSSSPNNELEELDQIANGLDDLLKED